MKAHHIKAGFLFAVLLVWAGAMVNWIFVEHIQPDPITWGVPQGIFLVLFPNGVRNEHRENDE